MTDNGLTVAEEPSRNVWFISERGKGFTCYADLALKTPQGWPVAAPGEGLIAARHVLKHKAKLWEHLLDAMEEYYNIEAEGEKGNRELRKYAIDKCDILLEALAILNHGSAEESALRVTKAEADSRYKLSSEGV